MSFIKASTFDAHSLAGLLFLLQKCHFAPKNWQSGQPAIALFLSLLLGPLLRSSPTVLRETLLRSFESVLRMWIWIWVFSVDICQGQSFCRRLVSFLHMQQDKLKLVHHAKAPLNPSCLQDWDVFHIFTVFLFCLFSNDWIHFHQSLLYMVFNIRQRHDATAIAISPTPAGCSVMVNCHHDLNRFCPPRWLM